MTPWGFNPHADELKPSDMWTQCLGVTRSIGLQQTLIWTQTLSAVSHIRKASICCGKYLLCCPTCSLDVYPTSCCCFSVFLFRLEHLFGSTTPRMLKVSPRPNTSFSSGSRRSRALPPAVGSISYHQNAHAHNPLTLWNSTGRSRV